MPECPPQIQPTSDPQIQYIFEELVRLWNLINSPSFISEVLSRPVADKTTVGPNGPQTKQLITGDKKWINVVKAGIQHQISHIGPVQPATHKQDPIMDWRLDTSGTPSLRISSYPIAVDDKGHVDWKSIYGQYDHELVLVPFPAITSLEGAYSIGGDQLTIHQSKAWVPYKEDMPDTSFPLVRVTLVSAIGSITSSSSQMTLNYSTKDVVVFHAENAVTHTSTLSLVTFTAITDIQINDSDQTIQIKTQDAYVFGKGAKSGWTTIYTGTTCG